MVSLNLSCLLYEMDILNREIFKPSSSSEANKHSSSWPPPRIALLPFQTPLLEEEGRHHGKSFHCRATPEHRRESRDLLTNKGSAFPGFGFLKASVQDLHKLFLFHWFLLRDKCVFSTIPLQSPGLLVGPLPPPRDSVLSVTCSVCANSPTMSLNFITLIHAVLVNLAGISTKPVKQSPVLVRSICVIQAPDKLTGCCNLPSGTWR